MYVNSIDNPIKPREVLYKNKIDILQLELESAARRISQLHGERDALISEIDSLKKSIDNLIIVKKEMEGLIGIEERNLALKKEENISAYVTHEKYVSDKKEQLGDLSVQIEIRKKELMDILDDTDHIKIKKKELGVLSKQVQALVEQKDSFEKEVAQQHNDIEQRESALYQKEEEINVLKKQAEESVKKMDERYKKFDIYIRRMKQWYNEHGAPIPDDPF